MKNIIKTISVVIFGYFILSPVFARGFGPLTRDELRRPAPVHLVYPINETADLAGDYLEFKWWHADIGIRNYDFRLYKGYEMYQDKIILKKTLPFNVSSLSVEAGLFEDNQVYTWSIIQIDNKGQKSDKSFVSFKVIKANKQAK